MSAAPIFATRDPTLANSFANDPDILPWCGFPAGTERVDVSSRIADPDILFLTDGDGAMICFNETGDGWEFHSMFRRSCRGRKAISVALAMFDWLVRNTGARTLLGTCPVDNRAVRWFCRQLGMVSTGIHRNGQIGPVELFQEGIDVPLAAAGIAAGGSILGGITGGKGASAAAKAEAQEQQQALQLQQQEFGTIQSAAQPSITAGDTSLQSIMQLLGLGSNSTGTPGQAQASAIKGIQQGPLYQSEFNSGLQGVDQSLAASGGLRGGNGALAQSTFGSNLLNSLYQQQIGNLGTVVGAGQSALSTLSSAGSNMVDQSSKTLSNLGMAEGTSAAAPYTALQNILNGLGTSGLSNILTGSSSSGIAGSGSFPTTVSAAPSVTTLLGSNLGYSAPNWTVAAATPRSDALLPFSTCSRAEPVTVAIEIEPHTRYSAGEAART